MATKRLKTKMNKKAFLPRTWVVSTLLFVTIFSLFYISAGGFLSEYDKGDLIDDGYNDRYNKFNDLIEQGGESYADIFQSMTDEKGFDFLDAVIGLPKVFVRTVKLLFESVGVMSGIGEAFAEDFGVPEEIANVIFGAIIVLISVILIFAILSSATKSNRI